MAMSFKKQMLNKATYMDDGCSKHKHNYCLKHLLIVTNINKKATANCYNSKDYFYVLKCDKCNSFIPDSVEGNFNHHIFDDEIVDQTLPVITANTMQKYLIYDFCKLEDVIVKNHV